MVIGFKFLAVPVGVMLAGNSVYSRDRQQINYLREDRLSAKKITFAHTKIVLVMLYKISGEGLRSNPLFFFTGHQ